MSIFDLHQPTQQTIDVVGLAYALKSAYVEMMDALETAEKACQQANAAANRVGVAANLTVANARREEIAAAFWRKFLESLPVMQVMSLQRREEEIEGFIYPHRKSEIYPLRNPNPPDFTVENMMKRAEELEVQRELFVREWAFDLFERFVHWGPALEEIVVPKKVIKTVIDIYASVPRIGYRHEEEVADLDRFFHFLDGRSEDFPNDYRKSPLVVAVAEAMKHSNGRGETDYFKFVGYSGNGRLHLTFKRRDLTSMWEALAREGLIVRMDEN